MSSASTLVAASSTLPLEGAALRVTARCGIARVVLEQRFANHHAEPFSRRRPSPLMIGAFTGASRPAVRAELVRRTGREITIEVHVPMELVWEPESFDVLLVDGGELTGRVDRSRTTRAGTLTLGQIARITIVLDADSEARIREIVFARHAVVVQ